MNLDDLASTLERRAALYHQESLAAMEKDAPGIETVVVESIKDVTPVDTSHLRDSITVVGPDGTGEPVLTGDHLEFSVIAPAESEPNWDGSGGGYHYVYAVLNGRAAITAPSDGLYSTGKLALRTPWGPRRKVGPAQPDPFPLRADPAIKTALELMCSRWDDDLVLELFGA